MVTCSYDLQVHTSDNKLLRLKKCQSPFISFIINLMSDIKKF